MRSVLLAVMLASCAHARPVEPLPPFPPVRQPTLAPPVIDAVAERLSATEAFAWAAVPMSFDQWATDHALSRPGAREVNPLGGSVEKRAALALAGSASAALLFHKVENAGPEKWRKVPRWTWVVGHGLAGLWNLTRGK